MNVFFDTEFTGFYSDAKLISIGFVAETGQTFYAELIDTYSMEDCSEFVIEHVLPKLEGKDALMPLKSLRYRLSKWLESLGHDLTLITDSAAWDGHFLRQILGSPIKLSRTVAILDSNGLCTKNDDNVPMSHHALHDATALQVAWSQCRHEV